MPSLPDHFFEDEDAPVLITLASPYETGRPVALVPRTGGNE